MVEVKGIVPKGERCDVLRDRCVDARCFKFVIEHIGNVHVSDRDILTHVSAHDLGAHPVAVIVHSLFTAGHKRLAVVRRQCNPTRVDLADWHIRALLAKAIEHTTGFELTTRGEHRDLKVHCGRSTYDRVQPHAMYSELTQDVFFGADFIISYYQAT